jgi:Domain of unknown function (DUF5668)/B-box zinc finger
MNCAQHPEIDATAFCRECGKPMCPECQRPALGSVYCEAHLPAAPPVPAQPPASAYPAGAYVPAPYVPTPYLTPQTASPYTAQATPPPADDSVHPVLALLLGFIPGVGAIYNGQYAKGLVHAVVFALLVSAEASGHNDGMEAFIGIMIAAWVFYMVFEAYHTARKRRYGIAVEEFSGHFDFRTGNSRLPVGAILLIGLGFILLLDTTDIISIDEFGKYWPVGMILLGVYLLYNRLNPGHGSPLGPNQIHDHSGKDAEARR